MGVGWGGGGITWVYVACGNCFLVCIDPRYPQSFFPSAVTCALVKVQVA